MNVDVPGLVNAALPNRRGRLVQVSAHTPLNHNDPGFLSSDFRKDPPKLYITAESDEFDTLTLNEWRDEGFDVEYISMGDGGKAYKGRLAMLSKQDLGPCETFGIVAYGDAASVCLEHFHSPDNDTAMKLGCLIAYYPTRIPDPSVNFPFSVQVLVHLAGDEIGVVKQPQIAGIQGKKRVVKKNVDPGFGTGRTNNLAYPCYTYDAEPGFAEQDLDDYDQVSAELAWSRSLATARRAFSRQLDLERLVDENVQSKFYDRNVQQTMSSYTTHTSPHVTYIPTLTGGIGAEELQRFYNEFFVNSNPPSMDLTLISRTIGVDRVVDELHVRFQHTQEMPWILPAVPPTNKWIEIMIVSIVTVRAGRLYHEHVYWDQASVLVQAGLLNPKLLPKKARELGVTSLPIVGGQAARRVLEGFDEEEEGEADNELIPGWYEDADGDGQDEEEEEEAAQQHEQRYRQATVEEETDDQSHSDGKSTGDAKGKFTGKLPSREKEPQNGEVGNKSSSQ